MSKDCYPGGKNAAGVYHAIINQMPKHRVYIEPFLGSGAIMRYKRPAAISYACEPNMAACQAFNCREDMPFRLDPNNKNWHSFGGGEFREALLFLPGQLIKPALRVAQCTFDQWRQHSGVHLEAAGKETLIYLDPPYLMETRSSKDRRYDPEFSDWFSHEELLAYLLRLKCNVMISGYDHPAYNAKLAGWRKTTYTGMTRGGARTEVLWMNFAEPAELHDYRYLGQGYRDRENIKRQQKRWTAKLRAMPTQQRYALLSVIGENGETADDFAVSDNTAKTPATTGDNGEA